LRTAIDDLEQNARPFGCVKLAGEPDLYRIRVGDYRIIYQVNDLKLTVLVLAIGHRREVYRR
jgi:mRNA interferase RelE/StbE